MNEDFMSEDFDDMFYDELRSCLDSRMLYSAWEYLKSYSQEYRILLDNNQKLVEQFPHISKVLEDDDLDQVSYTKDEVQAIKDYVKNVRNITSMQYKETYKLGAHDAMRLLLSIHLIKK